MRAAAQDAGRMLRRYSRLNARPDGSGVKLTRGSGMPTVASTPRTVPRCPAPLAPEVDREA